MTTESKIEIAERNGERLDRNEEILIVKTADIAHEVVLIYGDLRITVSASQLHKAISYAQNL